MAADMDIRLAPYHAEDIPRATPSVTEARGPYGGQTGVKTARGGALRAIPRYQARAGQSQGRSPACITCAGGRRPDTCRPATRRETAVPDLFSCVDQRWPSARADAPCQGRYANHHPIGRPAASRRPGPRHEEGLPTDEIHLPRENCQPRLPSRARTRPMWDGLMANELPAGRLGCAAIRDMSREPAESSPTAVPWRAH